jgi:hypothetical protein
MLWFYMETTIMPKSPIRGHGSGPLFSAWRGLALDETPYFIRQYLEVFKAGMHERFWDFVYVGENLWKDGYILN